jgi:hypothetical protein
MSVQQRRASAENAVRNSIDRASAVGGGDADAPNPSDREAAVPELVATCGRSS